MIKYIKGITKIRPSILSKIPPCPGKILPVSFTFASLLKYENSKSPNWDNKQTENVNINRIKLCKFKK